MGESVLRGEAVQPAAVRKIVALVAKSPRGLSRTEMPDAIRARYPQLPEARLTKLVAQALAAGLILESDGRFFVPTEPVGVAPDGQEPTPGRKGLRAVAIDLESLVRTVPTEPYLERRVYQAAAKRFGWDRTWSEAAPSWNRYVCLPGHEDDIRDEAARQRVIDSGVEPEIVWSELAAYVAGADLVVAYNGTGLDFPLVRDAAARAGCDDPFAGTMLVDALYLAHAVWPAASSHRLHTLAAAEGVPMSGLRAHSAQDDVELLIRLLARAGEETAGWDADLAELVADVCADSPGWRLLGELAGREAPERKGEAWDQQRVARLLGTQLADHPPRRASGDASRGRAAITVPDELRGADGRVDPAALAAVVHGVKAEPRPAQQRMATALHSWVDQGLSGLLEAPTGTGKSYAVLAAALDWLAAGDGRTAVIATFTKQLQSQMARDLKDLERALPGILQVADLVKGQTGRLSLASLTALLAEATRVRAAARSRTRFVDQPRFRELAVYLLLRLRSSTQAPQSWIARSVDPVDLPAFFVDYAGRALPLWLETLSQRDGDYRQGAETPLAPHTDTVREAIAGHRLVLANHALALSHLDDVRALGQDTLLVIDEAHELENAATSALTVALDYQDVEDLLSEGRAWVSGAREGGARDQAAGALNRLDELLDDERLPRLAARAFDARAKGVGVRVGSRTAVLASPYAGTSGSREAREIQRFLVRISRSTGAVAAALGRYAAEHAPALDVFVRERVLGLARRADDITSALGRLTSDIDALLNPALTLEGTEPDTVPSRVVYLEELADPEPGLRAYRFRVASSPIDLPADPEWRRYLDSFTRVHYVSATLRVAGRWTFLRERLGLAETLPTLALPSPFDLARQAELVCFTDFPSWAEQEEGAIRTVAHQLAGYAQEMTRARPDGNGHDGGAMVLTTARATAAGIGDELQRELRARTVTAPVVGALPLGNGRAVSEFCDPEEGGGFLVGTKGLWQGVDIADENRLRLVWINKLPFAPFAAPVVEARRAAVRERAEEAGDPDPDGSATEGYYLPLAALQLRQAVGRLIRSDRHRGVVIISDRKLGGHTGLRRAYRKAFLGSLDEGLLRPDPVTGETGRGNVTTMAEGWRRIWEFMAGERLVTEERAAELCTDDALERHTVLPQTRRIRELALTPQETEKLRADGRLVDEVLERSARIGGLLRLSDDPVELKAAQRVVIGAAAEGRNVLGLLPTGFGKSYTFQLPALVLPGTTLVVSPLVALMHDQALELNRSIGGAVRALISPLRESSSRAGKTEVADQLQGRHDHDIRLVYVSPERLCQRRFRELVRQAVAEGRVTRIAVDEAHTMAQWEDFRPSMRRVGRFLAELREEYGLPVTAVTATANRSVHAALREGLFGLTPEPPAAGSDEERAEAASPGAREGLVTVRENPIRPELAVFRRSLNQPGPGGVAGLAERVVDALDGHSILYCLTVKEVNALHAHLREYAGDAGARVLRFHGRLTEAEKAAVMIEFREAPQQGEEGFVPLVVVATSAFGLGVNRPDVRTVFCVSPPTDLAALYQQIGRAGRDAAGRGAEGDGPVNAAFALATSRGLRTVRFMTGQDLPATTLRRMGQEVLGRRGTLDAAAVAEMLMAEDAAAGRLDADELRNSHTTDRYRTGVMRAFSALADLGTVTDLGDYPPLCAVSPGELGRPIQADSSGPGDVPDREVVEAVLAMPDLRRLRVDEAHGCLVERIADYQELADGPAGTWEILADLHDRGLLDVSAAPSRRLVTGLAVHQRHLPGGFLPLLARRTARASDEFSLLKDFFEDTTVCAQRKFADYFGVPELPDGCCSTARCRCSACWTTPDWPAHERRPVVAHAFESTAPRTGGGADRALRAQRLDNQAYRLTRLMPHGIHPRTLWHALRGDETSYHAQRRQQVSLPRPLRESRHFGGRADLSYAEVEKCLLRLAEAGAMSEGDDGRWRAGRSSPTTESTAPQQRLQEARRRGDSA